MRAQLAPRTVRRLLSADGYMDLNMPDRAVAELEKIEDAGPLEGPCHLLHGIALKQLENHKDAITHLERAARLMPSVVRRIAWKELAECYRAVGSEELASLATKLAGDCDLQLKIALPFAASTIDFAMTPSKDQVEQ